MPDELNSRILLVDDNRSIHADFRKILQPERPEANVEDFEAGLFGETDPPSNLFEFELDVADQGEAGLTMVKAAAEAGTPYAMAFVDIRMPPGWDGLKTIQEIWKIDPLIEIVICTAYSDYSWNELVNQLGNTHRLLVLKKPFDPIEVLQISNSLVHKWNFTNRVLRSLKLFSDDHRAILEWIQHPVLTTDPVGNIRLANPAAAALLDYGVGELEGQPLESLIYKKEGSDLRDDDAAEEFASLADHLIESNIRSATFVKSDASPIDVEFTRTKSRDGNGDDSGMVILFCEKK